MEELRDVYSHFMLYYGHEIPAMRLSKKKKPKDEEQEEGEDTQEEEPEEKLKMPKRRDLYTICREAGSCWKPCPNLGMDLVPCINRLAGFKYPWAPIDLSYNDVKRRKINLT